MGATTCLICGAAEHEVSKLHSFPANLERSRIWQETLGFKFTGESLRNRKICSKHFAQDAYLDLISYKLRRDAVPISFVSTEVNTPSTLQVRHHLVEAICDYGFVKEGYPTIIELKNEHNHSLKTAHANSFLRPTANSRSCYESYFNDGMSLKESINYHKSKLEIQYGIASVESADARKNPKYRTVSYWYSEWRKINLGPRFGPGSLQVQLITTGESESQGESIHEMDEVNGMGSDQHCEDPLYMRPTVGKRKLPSQLPQLYEKRQNESIGVGDPSCNMYIKEEPLEDDSSLNMLVSKTPSGDDSQIYGEHIASKHRKYSQHTRSVVEHLISKILFNADMGTYENSSGKSDPTPQFLQTSASYSPQSYEKSYSSTEHLDHLEETADIKYHLEETADIKHQLEETADIKNHLEKPADFKNI